MQEVPAIRVRSVNDSAPNSAGDYILYWMISYRRGKYNFSLDRSIEWAKKLNKPLVILEALRCDYPWASDRLHRFVIQGMVDNAQHFANKAAVYYPYLEPQRGAGRVC